MRTVLIAICFSTLLWVTTVWAQQTPVQCPKLINGVWKSCQISFDANTESDMDHYTAYVHDVGAPMTVHTELGTIPHDPNLQTITGSVSWKGKVAEGKTYELWVTASDKAGNESGPSNTVLVTFDAPPGTPQNVIITLEP